MTTTCPVCGRRKGQRRCLRRANAAVCTLCCAESRDVTCGDCTYYIAAQQYRATRRPPATLQVGEFIAEVNPEVEQAANDALELVQRGKKGEAWTALTGLLRDHPRNHTVCYAMGTLYGIEGKHEEAIEWFDRALAIYPYFVEAHFNKAVSYQKQLDVGNAIRSYRKVVELGNSGDTTGMQAKSFLDGVAATILRIDGLDLDTYLASHDAFNRAFALMEQQDWTGALTGFRASAAKNGRNAPTHGNMGLCLAKLGRKAEALAEIDRALEIDPSYEPAMSNRTIVERMEEGRPSDFRHFKSIEYSKEQVLGRRETPNRGTTP